MGHSMNEEELAAYRLKLQAELARCRAENREWKKHAETRPGIRSRVLDRANAYLKDGYDGPLVESWYEIMTNRTMPRSRR